MSRNRLLKFVTIVLIGLLVAAVIFVVREMFFKPKKISAFFTTATAIYPGDDVRVSGVKVGTIDKIEPQGTHAKIVMHVDRDVSIPADAKAVIVAQNLLAARYVQFTPPYRGEGPTMPDGTEIPIRDPDGTERTAVPVEWDEVKEQLMRLAEDLGPEVSKPCPAAESNRCTAVARLIDSAATALDGNGDKLRQTLAQLSGTARILASGSGNIADIVKNLQVFVSALRDSNQQIVQFENRLATLTSVLNDNRSSLDAALTDLSIAIGEVRRFVAGTRDPLSETVERLANVTQTVADNRMTLENILHVAPTAFSNFYNIYNPDSGSQVGAPVLNSLLANPVWALCTMLGAVENVTSSETAKLCEQYVGPALRLLSANDLPLPINPFLMPAYTNVLYDEDRLAPGGEGPRPAPPERGPAISAYTGLPGDDPGALPWPYSEPGPPPPPPPARIPGISNPAPTTPASPPPPPGPAPAAPPTLPDLLLPAERPPS